MLLHVLEDKKLKNQHWAGGGAGVNGKSEQKARWRNKRSAKRTYLTFKHCKPGTGVDLSNTVGGCALVNSFVSVCAQWLDPQHGARAIIKLDNL